METITFNQKDEERLLQFFSSLADRTRLRILLSIIDGPKSVNEIYNKVGKNEMTLSAISHQLKLLSNLGIVSYKRDGKEKNFSLSDNFCWCILKNSYEHFNNKSGCETCNQLRG